MQEEQRAKRKTHKKKLISSIIKPMLEKKMGLSVPSAPPRFNLFSLHLSVFIGAPEIFLELEGSGIWNPIREKELAFRIYLAVGFVVGI